MDESPLAACSQEQREMLRDYIACPPRRAKAKLYAPKYPRKAKYTIRAWLFNMSCNIPEPVHVLKTIIIEALPRDIQEIITESCLEVDVNILVDLVEQLEASLRDQRIDIVRTQMQRLPAMPALLFYIEVLFLLFLDLWILARLFDLGQTSENMQSGISVYSLFATLSATTDLMWAHISLACTCARPLTRPHDD